MKKHYQVQFGDYQMELRGGEVLYRKKNSNGMWELVKARSVNNLFGSTELVAEAKKHAERMNLGDVVSLESGSVL